MSVVIRKLEPTDKEMWLELWQGYLTFYKHELSIEQTELSWSRLLESEAGLNALVAEEDGELLGLAHYWWTPSTWIENRDLYLEDLFVAESARGHGVARRLIESLVEICKEAGGSKVHWQTHKDNETARALYEQLAKQSEFLVYEIRFNLGTSLNV